MTQDAGSLQCRFETLGINAGKESLAREREILALKPCI